MCIYLHVTVPDAQAKFLKDFNISPSGVLQKALAELMQKFAPMLGIDPPVFPGGQIEQKPEEVFYL